MTVEDLLNVYNSTTAINYGVEFIDEQLKCLEDLHKMEYIDKQDEIMLLNIILSALKYYLDASPEGFEENIIDLVYRVEDVYNVERLLDCIIELEDI